MRKLIEKLELSRYRLGDDESSQYETVNDAAGRTGEKGLEKGNTEIWYAKESRDLGMGLDFMREYNKPVPAKDTLKKTHKLIGKIKERDPEEVFRLMQGETWSPGGEARNIIRKSGTYHTSMSVGDIVVIGGHGYFVDRIGFEKIW